MASKKKQHFVSQFLLKYFSVKNNLKLINLYNRDIDKLVENAPINTQAQESYFYGIDATFEDYLAHFEGKASAIIKRIIVEKRLPDYDHKDYGILLHFIMLFAFRTKKSVHNTEERINSAMKTLSKYCTNLQKIDFDKYRIVHPEPGAFNLARFMDNWVITYDLNSVLINNETKKDFYISDNPFIIYNPLMLRRKLYGLSSGLANKGLIIFFPISTKNYLMFYDSWAYETTEIAQCIELNKTEDIDNINLLQSISCDKNLYYSNPLDFEEVKYIAKLGHENKKDSYINDVFEHPFDKKKKRMLSYYLEHVLIPDLSFIKENNFARNCNDLVVLNKARNKEIENWIKMDKTQLRNHIIEKKKNPTANKVKL